jgi:YfiH family protein
VTLHQVHSPKVVTVAVPHSHDARPQADALVTDRPGLALGILSADCTPVLFADRQAGVVGAAHSGWKGAIGGVVEETVTAMEALGADRGRIVAAVGPRSLANPMRSMRGSFGPSGARPEHERFFSTGRVGHHQFDLEGFVVSRVAAAGVRQVEALGLDTYSDPSRFFSYRRATHLGEPDYGRQISLIAVPG